MHETVFKRKVRSAVARLPEDARERVSRAIESLVANPRLTVCRRLREREDWRIRIGDHRIIHGIDDDGQIVEILKVAHRRDVYR